MLNLILIGPQGSGKGTQAEKIVAEYGLTYLEMGALIRKRASTHDKKAEIIDHLANKKGQLLPDGVVLDMIYQELEEKPSTTGYLFDGFPRTANQYLALRQLLADREMKLTTGLYLEISDQEAIKRLATRRICDRCGKGYSLLLEPQRTACDCGGNLIQRQDDNEAAIKARLNLFHQNTQPVLEILESEGLLKKINGEQPVDKIFAEIKKQLANIATS